MVAWIRLAASPMTEAVRRPSFDSTVSGADSMDVPGLQALASLSGQFFLVDKKELTSG